MFHEVFTDTILRMLADHGLVTAPELESGLKNRAVSSGPVLGYAYEDALAILVDTVRPPPCEGPVETTSAASAFFIDDVQVSTFIASRLASLSTGQIAAELRKAFDPDRIPSQAAINRFYMRVSSYLPIKDRACNAASE